MMTRPLITLTTDFGPGDAFVGMMKGVILSICPDARIIDLDHSIEPQNVLGGAFTLAAGVQYFPSGAVHLAVVDPGVGTARKVLAVRSGGWIFVAPDNGLLTVILDRDHDAEVRSVVDETFFLKEISPTFHGRDVFAPLAAHLAAGAPFDKIGPLQSDPVRLAAQARYEADGALAGNVIRIDHFGNLMTNITSDEFEKLRASKKAIQNQVALGLGGQKIETFVRTFTDAGPGQTVFYVGSSGVVEIALVMGSAAHSLKAKIGDRVVCW
jgi:hypothetical protein